MTKIPTGDIIARSYGFAFGNFFGNLGIVWLPLLLAMTGLYFFIVPYIHAIALLFQNLPQKGDANGLPPDFVAAMQSLSRYAAIVIVGGLFLRAVTMLGVTQEALGTRKGWPFVYFAIGKDVWRLFGAYFIFYVLMQIAVFVIVFVVVILAAIVAGVVAVATGGHLAHNPTTGTLIGLGIFAAMIVLYGAIFWFLLRLGFLLTPVVVAEKKIDIARIWNLSKGNVWRMFLVCVAVFLPIFLVYFAILLVTVLHAVIPVFAPLSHNASPKDIGAHLEIFFNVMRGAWFIVLPALAIFATLFYGMAAGAMVFTYRALVPPPVDASVSQAG